MLSGGFIQKEPVAGLNEIQTVNLNLFPAPIKDMLCFVHVADGLKK